jgi:hypothetical protein
MDPAAAKTPRRVVLLPVEARSDELVRRYRLARLRLDGRSSKPGTDPHRFEHLKRMYD